MTNTLKGGCLCGAVRFQCQFEAHKLVVCHCKDCQKASGAGAAYNLRVPAKLLRITKGEPKTFGVTADSGDTLRRLFCADCGSQLFGQRENLTEFISIKAGTLDDSNALQVGMHIWVRSAAPWALIDNDIPKFDQEYAGLRQAKFIR